MYLQGTVSRIGRNTEIQKQTLSLSLTHTPDVEGDGYDGVKDDNVGPEGEEGGEGSVNSVLSGQEGREL